MEFSYELVNASTSRGNIDSGSDEEHDDVTPSCAERDAFITTPHYGQLHEDLPVEELELEDLSSPPRSPLSLPLSDTSNCNSPMMSSFAWQPQSEHESDSAGLILPRMDVAQSTEQQTVESQLPRRQKSQSLEITIMGSTGEPYTPLP